MKHTLWVLLFCGLCISALYAGGKKETESAVATDGTAFSETLDISGKKPGKYNFFIEARDQGGNTAIAGPHNMYIDPLSDLPLPRIINPREGMRVSGNLSVAGACTDDDGVQWVDLILNNDENTRVRAQGEKFFSYNYDTANLPDGRYTVTALAADINGLEEIGGRRNLSTVSWHLDRRSPEISLAGYESGALVHGRITIEGTVRDGNGVAGLEVSIGDEAFAPLRLREQKKSGEAGFSYVLDTTKIPNGPVTIRFRARDKQGSEGILASLFLVDNSAPELTLLYPRKEDGPVNGIFYAAGIARDTSGLASLSWEFGKEKGDFELVTGNPYWAKEFDSRNIKAGSVDLLIRAVDLLGNTAELKQKIQVDQKGDLPRLNLSGPAAKAVIQDSRIPLSGMVEDDDGVQGIYYSLDGGEPGFIPAGGGPFQALLPAAANGPHSLKVWARDITGVESVPVEIKNLTLAASGTSAGRFNLSLSEDLDGSWVRDEVSLTVKADESPAALEYSADLGQTWRPLDGISGVIPLSAFSDGYIGIVIRALGPGGTSTPEDYLFFGVNKDTVSPEALVAAPASGDKVNGLTLLALAIQEKGRLQAVEFAPDPDTRDRKPLEVSPFISLLIGGDDLPLSETMIFSFTDAAGNQSILNAWPFTIDRETDLPVAEINFPAEDQVLAKDFVLSGIAYDDDRVARIWYRIDDGEEISLEAVNSYSVPVALAGFADNEHTVTVAAEDIYGVRGTPVSRKFRVSQQEPSGWVDAPNQELINSGILEIRGGASDGNGVKRISLSLDNGYTYNEVPFFATETAAAGTVQWSYRFDTSVLKDGEYVASVKIEDTCGEKSLVTVLVNVDNTPPVLNLSSPPEAYTTGGRALISGQVYDNAGMDKILLSVRSVEGTAVPEKFRLISVEPKPPLLFYDLDLSGLTDGSYNIDIQALDKAANSARFSRNITLVREGNLSSIECLSPLYGEEVRGTFNLSGIVRGKAGEVTLRINGVDTATTAVSGAGYFTFTLNAENLSEGTNTLVVHSDFNGSGETFSPELPLTYSAAGPWVTVDSLAMGDFVYDRPWLSGRVGYALPAGDEALDKKADVRKAAAKKVKEVALSFDNGKTFSLVTLRGTDEWRFRIESEDMGAGSYYLLIRATMKNGESALTRTMFQIDTVPPAIRLLSPEKNGRYNQTLNFAALNSDDVALGEVTYTLRSGDKALYEVPGILRGLYVDGHVLGATLWDAGMGLSFFDDNVKFQVQYGQLTQAQYEFLGGEGIFRYGGNVFAAKLLANVYTLPFRSFLGPDWDWLSASAALGANFSLFSEAQSGTPTWMTAFLGQLEFPRITIQKWKFLRTFSFYTEFQLWFVPTDTNAKARGIPVLIPHVTFGMRYYIF